MSAEQAAGGAQPAGAAQAQAQAAEAAGPRGGAHDAAAAQSLMEAALQRAARPEQCGVSLAGVVAPGAALRVQLFRVNSTAKPVRLDEEERGIQNALEKHDPAGPRVECQTRGAVTLSDVWERIATFKPHCVHFMGHGAEESLLLADDAGKPSRHGVADLVELFSLHASPPILVVFNCCRSAVIAEQVIQAGRVQLAIGTSLQVKDSEALLFSQHFWRSVLQGTIGQAMSFALLQLEAPRRSAYHLFQLQQPPAPRSAALVPALAPAATLAPTAAAAAATPCRANTDWHAALYPTGTSTGAGFNWEAVRNEVERCCLRQPPTRRGLAGGAACQCERCLECARCYARLYFEFVGEIRGAGHRLLPELWASTAKHKAGDDPERWDEARAARAWEEASQLTPTGKAAENALTCVGNAALIVAFVALRRYKSSDLAPDVLAALHAQPPPGAEKRWREVGCKFHRYRLEFHADELKSKTTQELWRELHRVRVAKRRSRGLNLKRQVLLNILDHRMAISISRKQIVYPQPAAQASPPAEPAFRCAPVQPSDCTLQPEDRPSVLLRQIAARKPGGRVVVFGDAILDTRAAGTSCPGGAANVAVCCARWGMKVELFTAVGGDEAGAKLLELLKAEPGITVREAARKNTLYHTFAKHGDRFRHAGKEFAREEFPMTKLQELAEHLRSERPPVLIVSDYGGGCVNRVSLRHVLDCLTETETETRVLLDPQENTLHELQWCGLFAAKATEDVVSSWEARNKRRLSRSDVASQISGLLECNLIVTQGVKGLTLNGFDPDERKRTSYYVPADLGTDRSWSADPQPGAPPAHEETEQTSTVGCGDVVISTVAAFMLQQRGEGALETRVPLSPLCALMANTIASQMARKPWDFRMHRLSNPAELAELVGVFERIEAKVVSTAACIQLCQDYRDQQKCVAMAGGTFDLVHPGHAQLFQHSRRFGDAVVVAVNSDASFRSNRKAAPLNPERLRAVMLAAHPDVDHVVLFGEDSPKELIAAAKPSIFVKGADWRHHLIPEHGAMHEVQRTTGFGDLVFIPIKDAHSTSKIVERLIAQSSSATRLVLRPEDATR